MRGRRDPKRLRTDVQTETRTRVLIAALGGKDPSVHQLMKDKQKVARPHNGIGVSHKKGMKFNTCYNMREP